MSMNLSGSLIWVNLVQPNTCLQSSSMSKASTPPNFLKSTALPSITGLLAAAPKKISAKIFLHTDIPESKYSCSVRNDSDQVTFGSVVIGSIKIVLTKGCQEGEG